MTMRYVPAHIVPPVNRRRGVVYVPNGSLFNARSTAIPVQPTTNLQTKATMGVSAAAALWLTLTPTQKAAWAAGLPVGNSGYNYFLRFNQNAGTWGYPMVSDVPAFRTVTGVDFAIPYAEPDGINTTLCCIGGPPPSSGPGIHIHVYNTPLLGFAGKTTKYSTGVYLASFGPIWNDKVYFFDFTALQLAAFGQWYPNNCVDTASMTSCGPGALYSDIYTTDASGYPATTTGSYPFLQEWFYGPGPLAPGVCPIASSPPYPWPTARVYYG